MSPHGAMTATADRRRLCDAIAELERRDRGPAVRLALAEAEFRLAIAPGTEPAEAMARLRRAISYDPFLPKLHLHLGRLLHRSGKHTAALSAYRHAVSLAPSSRRAHLLMALALLELGKREQELGQSLIDALVRGESEQLRVVVAELDALAEEQSSPDTHKPDTAGKRTRARSRRASPGDAKPTNANAAKDLWRVALAEQLSRAKPVRGQVAGHLDTGSMHARKGDSMAEYATTCVLMAALGEPPAQVRKLARAAGADAEAGHLAFTMLEAVLDLAETADPAKFVLAAAEHLRHGLIPAELVVWLHFSKFADPEKRSALESIRLLDSYPDTVGHLDCFRELRLAVLDGHAHRAWAEERFTEAKLLWREASALDPHRVAVAINLALLAARTRSAADYRPAWERLAEVLYLHAAGAGEVQLLLGERKALHLALSQQSEHRHCPRASGPDRPSREELERWLADADTLGVWLREWDLYYLNARLHFRSPLHLLGQPKDASPEALTEAREALLRHIDAALTTETWAGIAVFCELARAQVHEAFRLAVEPLERARDPYYELEKAQAEALAGEMLERVLLLRKLMQVLIRRESGSEFPLGCSIARRQFALPRAALQRHCVDKGLIESDEQLFDILETDLVALASHWDRPEPTAADHPKLLAAFDESVRHAPDRLELRALRCRLLVKAERRQEAYDSAREALDLAPRPGRAETTEEIREALVQLIDHVGYLEVPEPLRQPRDQAGAEKTVAACRKALGKFPLSATLRRMLAHLLVQLGGEQRAGEAIEVLKTGIDQALNDARRRELQQDLGSIREEAARAHIRELAQRSTDRVKEAVEGVDASVDRQTMRAVLDVVRQAKADLSRLLGEAETAGFGDVQRHIDGALAELRRLERQLDDSEE
jgi:tetratricopeptide (TPR) repeat protein